MEQAERMQNLGSAMFTILDEMRRDLSAQGKSVINLSIGSPDQPPAEHIMHALLKSAENPANYGYTLSRGIPAFLESVAQCPAFWRGVGPRNRSITLTGFARRPGAYLPVLR